MAKPINCDNFLGDKPSTRVRQGSVEPFRALLACSFGCSDVAPTERFRILTPMARRFTLPPVGEALLTCLADMLRQRSALAGRVRPQNRLQRPFPAQRPWLSQQFRPPPRLPPLLFRLGPPALLLPVCILIRMACLRIVLRLAPTRTAATF